MYQIVPLDWFLLDCKDKPSSQIITFPTKRGLSQHEASMKSTSYNTTTTSLDAPDKSSLQSFWSCPRCWQCQQSLPLEESDKSTRKALIEQEDSDPTRNTAIPLKPIHLVLFKGIYQYYHT